MTTNPPSGTPLTTASGIPVPDNQNSITAGPRGPILLQDFHLIEKLQHFNRERIPERVVHAKGSGAYGTLTVTHDITKYTKARLFGSVGTDPIKFPDFVHTQKRDQQTNLKSAQMMWDFWSKAPESLHQVTMLFSDRGTPDGYRHMDGFGSHTFSLINARGERVWVKWHLKTKQGIKNLSAEEAGRLAGSDPDHAQRDLFNAIAEGNFPKWDVSIQVMTEADAVAWEKKTGWNPFDLTKVWPYGDFPRITVGVLELNRNPENYHQHVEQAAFSPANVVPGMGYSPDKMLHGRLFAYHDAQLYRVGTNHQHLPVNRARCPFHNQQRDGSMAIDNGGSAHNYETVNAAGSLPGGFGHGDPGVDLHGFAGRYDERGFSDDFTQAGNLFRVMTADAQDRLTSNIAGALKDVSADVCAVQVGHFARADAAYGVAVARKISVLHADAEKAKKLSVVKEAV